MADGEQPDEFDAWFAPAPASAPAPAPAPASSWFGGGSSFLGANPSSFLGSAPSFLGSLEQAAKSLEKNLSSNIEVLSSQARDVAGTLHEQGIPSVGAVTSRLKGALDESLTAFNSEAAKYCTEEAAQKEREELAHMVHTVGHTVSQTVGAPRHPVLHEGEGGGGGGGGGEAFVGLADAPAQARKQRLQPPALAETPTVGSRDSSPQP